MFPNFTIFFTIWKLEVFRRFSKNISTIFEKYFENVPKIIFQIFWHFYTREAILYVWKKFHNHSFFPSYFFHHLKIGSISHFADFWKIFQQFLKNILKMFPKLFFRFFCIFEFGQQFCICNEFFICIAFSHIFFLTIWIK